MIKTLVYIAVMALLLSCSKGGVEPFSPDGESGVPVAFSPSTDWQPVSGAKSSGTKSLIENAEHLKNYSISLLGNAVRGGDAYPVFKNHQLQWSNAEGWHYSPLKYWIPEANYTFVAFCPYSDSYTLGGSDSEPTIIIQDYDTSEERDEDLLYARSLRNTSTEGYSPVSLQFKHLLSCLSFNIRNASNSAITAIHNISLTGLLGKCDIKITLDDDDANITNKEVYSAFQGANRPVSGDTDPFLPKAMDPETFKPLFDCADLTVLPQNVYKEDIVLNFTVFYGNESTPYSLNLGSVNSVQSWEAGVKYNYNITISSKEIIFQVAEEPWKVHHVQLK